MSESVVKKQLNQHREASVLATLICQLQYVYVINLDTGPRYLQLIGPCETRAGCRLVASEVYKKRLVRGLERQRKVAIV